MPILDDILTAKRHAVERAEHRVPLTELERQARRSAPPRDFKAALMAPGLSLIAEIKRASPSCGLIAEPKDIGQLARQYQEGGAAAVSVLTEEEFFSGSLDDLRRIKDAVTLPVLRKDFLFDPYQVVESRAAGADAVLLIASLFEQAPLRQLIMLTRHLQMTPLIEVHDLTDLGRALNAGADVIGVNARDLGNFVVDPHGPLALAPLIPPGIIKVAESGIHTRQDVGRLQQAGYDAVLVGEALMRAEDPIQKLRELVGGG